MIFKSGMRWPVAGAPGFLKLILCGLSVCVRVCVSVPEAINNYWHDIDLIWLVKQATQLLYGYCSPYH